MDSLKVLVSRERSTYCDQGFVTETHPRQVDMVQNIVRIGNILTNYLNKLFRWSWLNYDLFHWLLFLLLRVFFFLFLLDFFGWIFSVELISTKLKAVVCDVQVSYGLKIVF